MENSEPGDKFRKAAEKRTSIPAHVVHQAIVYEGEAELKRVSSALAWSAFAAGLSMGFSMIGRGLLHAYLPDTGWRPLVEAIGYCLGFVIVIMGRQELFTETTLTPVLPIMIDHHWNRIVSLLRVWIIVLSANLTGGLVMAVVSIKTAVFEPDIRSAFIELGVQSMQFGFGTVLLRGIFAGWLIALIVWLLPFAESGRIWVIIILTYTVGLAHLSHSVAGTIEVFTLAVAGQSAWLQVIGSYVVPAIIGNLIGGTTLVACFESRTGGLR